MGQFVFFFFFFFMCLWYSLLVAQIWQTVADCQSAIISCGTWAGWTCPVQFCYVGSSFMFIVLYYMLFCVAGLIKISWIGLKFLGRSQSLKISDMSDRSMRETLKKKKSSIHLDEFYLMQWCSWKAWHLDFECITWYKHHVTSIEWRKQADTDTAYMMLNMEMYFCS